jgi:hypothetical protein
MLYPAPELPNDTSLDSVRFSTQIRNALTAAGWKTVGEIREASDDNAFWACRISERAPSLIFAKRWAAVKRWGPASRAEGEGEIAGSFLPLLVGGCLHGFRVCAHRIELAATTPIARERRRSQAVSVPDLIFIADIKLNARLSWRRNVNIAYGRPVAWTGLFPLQGIVVLHVTRDRRSVTGPTVPPLLSWPGGHQMIVMPAIARPTMSSNPLEWSRRFFFWSKPLKPPILAGQQRVLAPWPEPVAHLRVRMQPIRSWLTPLFESRDWCLFDHFLGGSIAMVRNSGLLVLTVLLRVTGTLMLLGGLVAVIMGFADIVLHELNYADPATMLGWFKFTLGVVSAITGFAMLIYGQVLLLMITLANNTRPIKELAENTKTTTAFLSEAMKRILREGTPALTL